MMVLLTILSILLLLAFVAVLVVGLAKIMRGLEAIGNAPTSTPGSLLAKIRWGVRAIEKQAEAIGPQASRLNSALAEMEGSFERLRSDISAVGPGRPRSGG